jgi:ubiquinol-cytochrome c reductase cytochrome b subunit
MPRRRLLRWFDDRLGAARFATTALNRVFPDHWSFMLGEIALYSFVVLVLTGTYLTFFFQPSFEEVVYQGSYEPLQGVEMSAAYASALDISFDVRAGLVMRQMHHWAALVFVAAIVVHLMRVFFTGAYKRPREINWVVGVTLLALAIFNGLFGYSLLDDLLSGTGVRVAYSITLSIPFIGPDLAFWLFGGEFPGVFIPRFFVLHILVIPAIIVALLSVHLALVWHQKHTEFGGRDKREDVITGERLWPTYAAKSVALFLMVAAVLAGLGGLAQINPIWVYGPFRSSQAVAAVTSASQPDWYMGWIDGALRIFPAFEPELFDIRIPAPFLAGVVLPTLTFAGLYLWPWLEARRTGDRAAHNLLDRPRDHPVRTSIGTSVFAFYTVLFMAGSNDVLASVLQIGAEQLVWFFRVAVFALPVVVFAVTYKICRDLARVPVGAPEPPTGHRLVRTSEGAFESR